MAKALGPEGLDRLKARFEELASKVAAKREGERRVIGVSTRGPIYEDDFERSHHARVVRSALTEIADALGDE